MFTSAQETTSDGIPVCSVGGRLAPKINLEALLPLETWKQRYLQLGCGGPKCKVEIENGEPRRNNQGKNDICEIA